MYPFPIIFCIFVFFLFTNWITFKFVILKYFDLFCFLFDIYVYNLFVCFLFYDDNTCVVDDGFYGAHSDDMMLCTCSNLNASRCFCENSSSSSVTVNCSLYFTAYVYSSWRAQFVLNSVVCNYIGTIDWRIRYIRSNRNKEKMPERAACTYAWFFSKHCAHILIANRLHILDIPIISFHPLAIRRNVFSIQQFWAGRIFAKPMIRSRTWVHKCLRHNR